MKVWGLRFLRCAFPLALILGFAIGAMADNSDMRIVFDPTSGDPPATITDVYDFDLGTPLTVTWQSCSDAGIPASLSGDTACLALDNVSGVTLDAFTLQFTTPTTLEGFTSQDLTCETSDSSLTTNNCPESVGADSLLDVTFSQGTGEGVPSYTNFYIGAYADCGGVACALSDFTPATVIASAAEPSSFMLALPLLFFILAVGWLRRAASRESYRLG